VYQGKKLGGGDAVLRLRKFLYDKNLNGTGGDYFHTFCHIHVSMFMINKVRQTTIRGDRQ